MEFSSPMSRALTIPEILGHIFDLLGNDARTLAAACLVNQQWFSCGADVLWKLATYENLLEVPEERQQIYAAKMTSLSFAGDDAAICHARFRHLQFSSLKRISLDSYHEQEGEIYYMGQYLQPPLEGFYFYGGQLSEELLDHLRSTCWKLQHILIDSPGPKITADFFFNFVTEYSSLKDIKFRFGMNHLVSDELLVRLANRDALSGLEIGRVLSQELLERILAKVSDPFKGLKDLAIEAAAAAVPALVKVFRHTSSLQLDVEGDDSGVVKHLGSLSGLKRLKLTFSAPTRLSVDDVLSLKKLSRLEVLEIGPNEMVEDATVDALESGFSDENFEDICSHLPRLRILDFAVQSSLSTAAFESLSKHCRMLEECKLPAMFDLETLDLKNRRTVMFPKLWELDVGGFERRRLNDRSTSDDDAADEAIELLRKHFPNLQFLYADSDDDYTNSIVSRVP